MAKKQQSPRTAGDVNPAYADRFKAGQRPQPADFAQLIDDSFFASEVASHLTAAPQQGLSRQPADKIQVVTTGGIHTNTDNTLAVNISPRIKIDAESGKIDGNQWFSSDDFYALTRHERQQWARLFTRYYDLESPVVNFYSCQNKDRLFIQSADDIEGEVKLQAFIFDSEHYSPGGYITSYINVDNNTGQFHYTTPLLPDKNGDHILLRVYYSEDNDLVVTYCCLSVVDNAINIDYQEVKYPDDEYAEFYVGVGRSVNSDGKIHTSFFRPANKFDFVRRDYSFTYDDNKLVLSAGKFELFLDWLINDGMTIIPTIEPSLIRYMENSAVYESSSLYFKTIIYPDNFGLGFSSNGSAAMNIMEGRIIFLNPHESNDPIKDWSPRPPYHTHYTELVSYPVVSKNFMSPSGNVAFYIQNDTLIFYFKTGDRWGDNLRTKKISLSPPPPEGKKIIAAELQDNEQGGAFLYYTYEDSLKLYYVEVKP